MGAHKMRNLLVLNKNIVGFCRGLSSMLDGQLDIKYTHLWSSMLACYTGNQSYHFHIDNPEGSAGLPENGLRLSLCYFINPHWDNEGDYHSGGIDVYLTDQNGKPAS